MSKKIYLFSLVLLTLVFVSCEETQEVGRYDNWQSRNESFIDSLENVYATAPDNGGLKRIESLFTAPGEHMYYKVVDKKSVSLVEDENPCPKYTDYVKVYYKGTNILGEYFDGNFKGENPIIKDPDTGEGDSTPVIFKVGEVITGWSEALQRMKVNDRWIIYVPWHYGYGSEGSGSAILGYSTLIFDVELIDYASTEAELKN